MKYEVWGDPSTKGFNTHCFIFSDKEITIDFFSWTKAKEEGCWLRMFFYLPNVREQEFSIKF